MSESQQINHCDDLRKLPVEELDNALSEMGVEAESIKKMARWEKVNLLRDLKTQQKQDSQQNQDSH